MTGRSRPRTDCRSPRHPNRPDRMIGARAFDLGRDQPESAKPESSTTTKKFGVASPISPRPPTGQSADNDTKTLKNNRPEQSHGNENIGKTWEKNLGDNLADNQCELYTATLPRFLCKSTPPTPTDIRPGHENSPLDSTVETNDLRGRSPNTRPNQIAPSRTAESWRGRRPRVDQSGARRGPQRAKTFRMLPSTRMVCETPTEIPLL